MVAKTNINGFDYEDFRDSLVLTGVESFKEYYRKPSYDAHDALSEAAFDAADEGIAYDLNSIEQVMAVLMESPNDPTEWEPFVEGKDDWRDILKGVAFTVVRQDFYDEMEEQGYLDDHWNVTDKLLTEVEQEA